MAEKKDKKPKKENDETPVDAAPAEPADEPTVEVAGSSEATDSGAGAESAEAAEEVSTETAEEPVVEVAAEAAEPEPADAPVEEPPAEEPAVEVAAEAVAEAEPEEAPAEEPAAEVVAEAEAEPAAEDTAVEEPAEEPAAVAAEPEAAPVPPAPQSGPKLKKKRPPRALRRQRTKTTPEKPATRKPIVRLEKPEHDRGRRQERQGTVVSNAMDKTIVVKVDVLKAHPKYKKVVRRSSKFHAHDEANQANVGDVVRIVETRPVSKSKRWRLAEIVEAAK